MSIINLARHCFNVATISGGSDWFNCMLTTSYIQTSGTATGQYHTDCKGVHIDYYVTLVFCISITHTVYVTIYHSTQKLTVLLTVTAEDWK